MKKLYYFGCIREVGHFLWEDEGCQRYSINIPGVNPNFLKYIDEIYTPGNTQAQGIYLVSYVPPATIIAWHDYTVDKRPGSNSNLIAIGYDTVEEILEAAKSIFPSVMNRQPQLISSFLNDQKYLK